MLLSLAAVLLAPVHLDDVSAEEYAQCAYVASLQSQAPGTSEANKKAWTDKAKTYLAKAAATAYPGRKATDAETRALGVAAAAKIKADMKDLDGRDADILLGEKIMICEL